MSYRRPDIAATFNARLAPDPCNVDDAEYMLAHPADFSAEELKIAEQTERQHIGSGIYGL